MHETCKVVSVNVGKIREVESAGRQVLTGIFKTPVEGPVRAVGVNLEGDDQADRTVHGGPDKAVYAFPAEHYDNWRAAYPNIEFGWGAFGENLTTAGILEDDVVIGSRFQCGDVELQVTEPRMPCFKFAIRLGDKSVIKRMLKTGHTGFYFAIAREGSVQAGDALQLLSQPKNGLSVSALTDLYRSKEPEPSALRAALEAPGVPESWQSWLEQRLSHLDS